MDLPSLRSLKYDKGLYNTAYNESQCLHTPYTMPHPLTQGHTLLQYSLLLHQMHIEEFSFLLMMVWC